MDAAYRGSLDRPMRRALLITLLGLVAPACRATGPSRPEESARASAKPPLEVSFEPPGGILFKLEEDLGMENWDFGLRVRGETSRIARLRIEHSSAGLPRQIIELDRVALSAYRAEPDGVDLILRHLHQRLPQALGIDRMSVVLLDESGELGRGEVPLARYAQTNAFRLPIRGCWFVSSGHDFGVEHRRWYTHGHFAWDLIRVDAEGDPGAGPTLAESLSFGQPVFAPAAGLVVEVHDGGEDRPPGNPGPREEANFILLDHGAGERSRLVHLKKGSIRVRPGERVQEGQLLAEVGNSGMTDGPHLHVAFETEQTLPATGEPVRVPLPI
jgi:murein DD-endopeptidase MepM/ murein hydrolase activator NlpD